MERDPLKILKSAVQIIVFLFAAFGGFLSGLAPPEETGVRIVLGFASFVCLILLLVVSALASALTKAVWVSLAIVTGISFVLATFTYQRQLQELTFVWSPSNTAYVTGGDDLTPKAAAARQRDPSLSDYDLVAGFGGIDKNAGIDRRSAVWPQGAILSASRTLTFGYVWTVLSGAVAVFCALEAAMKPRSAARQRRLRRR
jgi:hypothetical protein